jgi:sugar phosphate isomerase/epimerase
MVEERAMRRNTMAALRATGGTVFCIEVFRLTPNQPVTAWRPYIEVGAELGAERLLLLSAMTDRSAEQDELSRLCELCRPYNIRVAVEHAAGSGVPSLAAAIELVRSAAGFNPGLVIDSLNFFRAGGTVADLASIPSGRWNYTQLADGPATIEEADRLAEARENRLFPGEGALPLRGLIAAMPADVPLGIEVPAERLRLAGVGPAERVRCAVVATRRLLSGLAGEARDHCA